MHVLLLRLVLYVLVHPIGDPAAPSAGIPWGSSGTFSSQILLKTWFHRQVCCYWFLDLTIFHLFGQFYQNWLSGLKIRKKPWNNYYSNDVKIHQHHPKFRPHPVKISRRCNFTNKFFSSSKHLYFLVAKKCFKKVLVSWQRKLFSISTRASCTHTENSECCNFYGGCYYNEMEDAAVRCVGEVIIAVLFY